MRCIAIETSCDETAASILEADAGCVRVLAEEVCSQINLHERYGGVVPELASREHLRNLPLLVDSVMSKSSTRYADLNFVAVTKGPGLKGCLLIGVGFAKGMALAAGVPLLGINHIEGHMHAPSITDRELKFPYLSLVVSGGHTEICLVRGLGEYELVARTMDDAAGEAFDKAANLLGFVYPGGASLAALADKHRPAGKAAFKLPRVMREAKGFSFSGLKTAIQLLIKKESGGKAPQMLSEEILGALAWAVQEAIVDALVFKLNEAVTSTKVSTVVVSGGVSANKYLRSEISRIPGVRGFFPEWKYCMDNASMIGYVGMLRYLAGERDALTMEVLARWPVEELVPPTRSRNNVGTQWHE